MYLLNRADYERVRPLFRKLDNHLPLQAMLAGNIEAPIYVDNPRQPQVAVTWTGHRIYLLGKPGYTNLISEVRKIFLENFMVKAWNAGIDSYILHYSSSKWEDFIQAMLTQKYPIKSLRSYYSYRRKLAVEPDLPEGFTLRTVERSLLTEKWKNLDFLTDEMCSERESVDDFLEKSFGICLTQNELIVGWCLSEYNTGHRCEVGIATHEDYRRMGLGTFLAKAFIETTKTKQIAGIGWHCHATNLASGATALKAGFEKIEDYPVYIGWFDDGENIARNGYFAHGRGEYAEALKYYEKSLALGETPDWVYWGAACDAAMIGENEKALRYLSVAIDHGYDDLDQIMESKYLLGLHDAPGWKEIIKKLA